MSHPENDKIMEDILQDAMEQNILDDDLPDFIENALQNREDLIADKWRDYDELRGL